MKKRKPVHIAIDFDKTLAYHESEWGVTKVGSVIKQTYDNLACWLRAGHKITIFTSRVAEGFFTSEQIKQSKDDIRKFLLEHGLPTDLPITAVKDPTFSHILDDRAYNVSPNVGDLVPYPDDLLC